MIDKKTFGSFIKTKRNEKNYSQKELADLLFVTEWAVSKWERGLSYPDITLLSDICRVLGVSEHELLNASTDTETRRLKREARSFRVIRGIWFWIPTILYAVAILTCFICNLAVNHTLSWFFIVLSSLICAYTFIPTVTGFFRSRKLLVFGVSTYLSIALLLFTCAVYVGDTSWLLNACIGTLIGYELVFMPIILAKSRVSRYKFPIAFGVAFVLTVLLLINIDAWTPIMLMPAIGITCYGFVPAFISAFICTLRFDGFLKAGICVSFSSVLLYCVELAADRLFGTNDSSYEIDFGDWARCLEGNIQFICLISFLVIAAAFILIGALRMRKRRYGNQ